jgi:hypothetical protein
LGGLTIQNGTGNVDNVTNLFEGINTAGNTTSFIRADGYISAATVQTGGVVLNSNGLTATSISATTYLGLPISGSSSQVAYFNSNSGLTGSTNFLYSGGTLLVRAIGNTSASLPFVIRNSADTLNNFVVDGLGQGKIRSTSFVPKFSISYISDAGVDRDAFVFTQNVQNAMGRAWTFDAGYNGAFEGLQISNDLTGNDKGLFTIQLNNYCFGTNMLNSDTGTNERRVLRIANGVSPTTSKADEFKFYSADITAGNAAPHFRTENGNVVKLYTHSAVTTVQGVADALTTLGLLTASTITSGGIVGISNSFGLYSYYSTFSSAMSAATSGQTIELFSDINETTNTAINLKNGVNINGNNHTYTLITTGTSNCFQDAGVAVNCSISNIIIKRLGGTASSTDTLCLYITGASNIKAYGTKLIGGTTNMRCLTINNAGAEVFGIYAEGYNPTITVTNGTLNDSTAKSLNGGGISVGASGKIVKCIGYGVNVGGISNAGLAIDSFGYDPGVAGFGNSGTAINCTGWSNGSGGFTQGSVGTAINCIGYSTANVGFFINGATNVTSCKGYSTANVGLSMINSVVYDCLGFSTANNGIYAINAGATITELRSCKAISTSAAAINMANTTSGSKIYNTEVISKWNNASGHGIILSGNNTQIVQCTIEVTNSSANCLFGLGSLTTKYANNAFAGSLTAVTSNITQGMVNTHDAQGNILI